MFKLVEQEVLLNNYNPRTEKHGQDSEPASSLQFKMTGLNTLLDLIDPDLRETYFVADPAKYDIEEGYLPSLRFPLMPSIVWNLVQPGCRVTIHGELETSKDLNLINAEIKSFQITLKEGGSVEIAFTVNCHPNEDEAGWIYIHMKTGMTISIEPPSADDLAQRELDMLSDDE